MSQAPQTDARRNGCQLYMEQLTDPDGEFKLGLTAICPMCENGVQVAKHPHAPPAPSAVPVPEKVTVFCNSWASGAIKYYRATYLPDVRLSSPELIQMTERPLNDLINDWQPQDGFGVLYHSDLLCWLAGAKNYLFVRSCYPSFFRHCYALALSNSDPNGRGFCVYGTPGIGKTAFLLYVLVQLLLKRANMSKMSPPFSIVLDAFYVRLVFTPDGPSTDKVLIDAALQRHDSWYLYDDLHGNNGHPAEVAATTIFTTSPNAEIPSFGKRNNAHLLCMPPWEWWELLACREACLSTIIDRQTFLALYGVCGGVIRPMMQTESGGVDAIKAGLVEKINATNVTIESVSRIVGNRFFDSRQYPMSHSLFHMFIDSPTPGNDFRYGFASDYIRDQVVQKCGTHQQETCRLWLATHTDALYAAVRGHIFESFAHRQLADGGDFRCRRLGVSSSVFMMRVDRRTAAPFEDLRNLGADVYGIPKSRCFAAVDAVVRPNMFLQCTVSGSHPIKMRPLERWIADLGCANASKLFFVVPDDKFDGFGKQPYHTPAGTVAQSVPPAVANVEQYVLCVPLTREEPQLHALSSLHPSS